MTKRPPPPFKAEIAGSLLRPAAIHEARRKREQGIATRFDKLAKTFLAGVLLVGVLIWLN